ncbi:MAG: hypothetical protein Kow001_17680 [Acidobacteriota bacterium]
MYFILLLLHLIASAILILVVLLQSGKAGDLASTFGGATSQAAFGARGAATVLTKATTLSAIVFMLTSLSLAILYTRGTGTTIMDRLPATPPAATETAPATPAPGEAPAAAPAEQPSTPGDTSGTSGGGENPGGGNQ